MGDAMRMPTFTLPNGLHPSVSREAYDKLSRTNWSSLKHLGRSPAHYRHNQFNGRTDTTALRLGRAAHLAVLEPERYRAECAVWDGGRRAGNAWEAFKEAHKGYDILTEDEHAQCLALAAAVRANTNAAPYLSGGRAEVTALWTDAVYGLDCKARLDFEASVRALVDLKTTRDASPEGFAREALRFQLHVQAAFYCDGYEAATGQRLPYVLVAVEKEPPHVVQVYRVPEAILALGRETYRELLGQLADCRRESRWPGYASGELELTLPRWAVPQEDEDLSELELVIGGDAHGA